MRIPRSALPLFIKNSADEKQATQLGVSVEEYNKTTVKDGLQLVGTVSGVYGTTAILVRGGMTVATYFGLTALTSQTAETYISFQDGTLSGAEVAHNIHNGSLIVVEQIVVPYLPKHIQMPVAVGMDAYSTTTNYIFNEIEK